MCTQFAQLTNSDVKLTEHCSWNEIIDNNSLKSFYNVQETPIVFYWSFFEIHFVAPVEVEVLYGTPKVKGNIYIHFSKCHEQQSRLLSTYCVELSIVHSIKVWCNNILFHLITCVYLYESKIKCQVNFTFEFITIF